MASKQQEEDFQWFLKNYASLSEKYAPAYLIIKNGSVLGAEVTPGDALNKALITEEMGSFIIQECDGTVEAYTSYISSTCFL